MNYYDTLVKKILRAIRTKDEVLQEEPHPTDNNITNTVTIVQIFGSLCKRISDPLFLNVRIPWEIHANSQGTTYSLNFISLKFKEMIKVSKNDYR